MNSLELSTLPVLSSLHQATLEEAKKFFSSGRVPNCSPRPFHPQRFTGFPFDPSFFNVGPGTPSPIPPGDFMRPEPRHTPDQNGGPNDTHYSHGYRNMLQPPFPAHVVASHKVIQESLPPNMYKIANNLDQRVCFEITYDTVAIEGSTLVFKVSNTIFSLTHEVKFWDIYGDVNQYSLYGELPAGSEEATTTDNLVVSITQIISAQTPDAPLGAFQIVLGVNAVFGIETIRVEAKTAIDFNLKSPFGKI